MSDLKILQITNKTRVLVYKNNLFKISRSGAVSYWKCKHEMCIATVKLINYEQQLIPINEHHSHEPPDSDLLKVETKSQLKRALSEEPHRPVKQIFKEVMRNRNEELNEAYNEDQISDALFTYENIHSFAYRERRSQIPNLPNTRSDIQLSGERCKSLKNEDFLLVNDGMENKILVFGTKNFLKFLCNSKCVFMDGTFFSAPKLFFQLYTLHGIYKVRVGENENEVMVPFIYALLPSKSKETYIRLFLLIKNAAISQHLVFNPPNFQIDFEMSAIQAIKTSFPNSDIHGCLFHFSQSLWRKTRN